MPNSEPTGREPTVPWPEGVPQRGDVVGGKYVCEDLLGAGGMGAVLSARHTQLGQKVAIKVLLPAALKNPLANERFLREARSVITLRSEHVARVVDFGTLDSGSPYLVMEYLEGRDLKALLAREGPLSLAPAVDLVIQACEALCEAHQQGIVHRDLKPANLFLSKRVDGAPLVKVLDFGISKTVATAAAATGSGPGLTKTDAVFGTPAYMSPEQLRSSKLVDHRADVWSLGVTLYELLTAKLPFGSENDGIASMCAHILEDPPPALRDLRADVPAGFETVLHQCMAKNPADRPESIADLVEELAPFASPASAEILSRIARMSTNSLPFEPTLMSDSSPQLSGRPPSSGWGRTGSRTSGKKEVVIGVAASAALLVSAAVGWAWWTGSQQSLVPNVGVVAELDGSVVTEAPDVVTPLASAIPTVSALVPLVPTALASAEATAPTPGAKLAVAGKRPGEKTPATSEFPASSAPAQPTCGPGEVLSNGHCCASGFEWKGGACVPGVAKGL
jgi:serine/threonine-protein kinase